MRKVIYCKNLKIYDGSTCDWPFNVGTPEELFAQMQDHFKNAKIHQDDRNPSITLDELKNGGAKKYYNKEDITRLDTK